MARFLSQHPKPWGWNPLAYCGMPVQFMYVPGLLYASALGMRMLPHAAPDTVYRAIVSFMTCLGPVTLFLFALHFTKSRRWAFVTALAYSLLLPSYLLFPEVEKDRGIVQLPRRILAAALLLAAILLVNWVAAFTLAISCMLLLLAAWGEKKFQTWRVAAAASPAYLLACIWLTPSFIRTIAFNWPADSFAYRLGDRQVWLLAGVAAGTLILRLLFRLWRGSFYLCVVTMGAFVFGWIATAFYVYGVDTIPESRRYAIEFELLLALSLGEGFRLAMRNTNGTVRLCALGAAGVMLLAGGLQLWAYVGQGWQKWMPVPAESTVEYRGRGVAARSSAARPGVRFGRPVIPAQLLARSSSGWRRVRNGIAESASGRSRVPDSLGEFAVAGPRDPGHSPSAKGSRGAVCGGTWAEVAGLLSRFRAAGTDRRTGRGLARRGRHDLCAARAIPRSCRRLLRDSG